MKISYNIFCCNQEVPANIITQAKNLSEIVTSW